MAWRPGNTSQLDLGEIPHKKEISDEELANMRANAPDREEREAMAAYETRQQAILDDIVNEGDEAVDSLTLINEIQDNEEFGIGPSVLDPEFSNQVDEKLNDLKSPLSLDTVLDVWYKKELSPGMFYFGIAQDDDVVSGFYVVLVPIPVWEEHKTLDDREFEDYVVPEWLSRLTEAMFEVTDGRSPSKARRELVKLGFVENHDIAS